MSQYSASNFPFVKTNKSITVHFNGDSRTAIKGDSLYDKLDRALTSQDWDLIPTLLYPESYIATASHQQMKVEEGQVYVQTAKGWWPVPSDLNNTIIEYMNNDNPFDRLVKFAVNLSENPSYLSVQQLFNFLNKNNFTITPEGKFIAYRSVRPDYKDWYTGTFDNSPGCEPRVERSQVDDDPTRTCSRGLHVAAMEYARDHYGSWNKGSVLIYVEVDPKDVVAVPADYHNQKMRVCGYKVLGVCEKPEEFKSKLYEPGVTEQEWENIELTFDDF